MPTVYEGDLPYIYMSYAHADNDVVSQLTEALSAEGYRVWFDAGIEMGMQFPSHIANRINDCACLIVILSRASLRSDWCRNELGYALELGKDILPIYLEDVKLPRSLEFQLGHIHPLIWHRYETDGDVYKRLFSANSLQKCLTPEGAAKRSVKAKTCLLSDSRAVDSSGHHHSEVVACMDPAAEASDRTEVNDKNRLVVGVTPKPSLGEYSWDELKAISWSIAASESYAGGLTIAREYSLVDENGKLNGDRKELALRDGTRTSARIMGFRHDEIKAGGVAGISFEFADAPASYPMNPLPTNQGGWKSSQLREWLDVSFIELLPDDLRALVEAVRKRTNNVGQISRENDTSVVSETTDRLWLLSMSEVYGKISAQSKNVPRLAASYDAEGTQYQLYRDKGVTTRDCAFCRKRGADSWWLLRSPLASSSEDYIHVYFDGDWGWNAASDAWGVSPGFCI